jgi:penicillin-binding protein 1C
MEELIALYGALANGGEYRALSGLRQGDGSARKRLLSPQAAFLTRRMLEANPPPQRSFGVRSFGRGSPVAWKTGTSSGLKDAWAVGLAGDLLAGVWVGNFDGAPNRQLVGRELAGPLLFGILEAVGQERPAAPARPAPPPGLKSVEICPLSGALRSPWCPHGKTGWIIPGVSPIKTCAVHRQIFVDPATGLRLCRGEEGRGQPQVAEFWDSDVLELFRLAGLRRAAPPPFAKPCDDLEGGDAGAHPPAIASPRAGVSYPVRAAGHSAIEFSSVSDGGRRRLFWFVDDAYVGEGATILWPAKPGQFVVRVVDDQGQSAATTLTAVPAE